MTLIVVSGTRHAGPEHGPQIEFRLSQWRPRAAVTLVHGDAPGVDRIAAGLARGWGWAVTAVPAEWPRCDDNVSPERGGCPPRPHLKQRRGGGWYCPYAGNRRNQLMVDRYPLTDVVVAFPALGSAGRSGTWDLIHRAADAGLTPQIYPLAVQRVEARPLLHLPDTKEN